MEKEKQPGGGGKEKEKRPGGRAGSKPRRLKVTAVYGDAMLMDCMKHIIRGKYDLR